MITPVMKRFVFSTLKGLQADGVSRYLNRANILILAYHGVTSTRFSVQPWTMVSDESFEEQMRFLSRNYTVLPLRQVVTSMAEGAPLSHNTAVVTFDDGYRNNFTHALPVLSKYNIPATIYLTAGYVGTENLLPLDEAYVIVASAQSASPVTIDGLGTPPLGLDNDAARLRSYNTLVHALKRHPTTKQKRYIEALRERLDLHTKRDRLAKEFRLLDQSDIRGMAESGLVHFGAHTVSHEILTNVDRATAEREIADSKAMLETITCDRVDLFAYPNGRPTDFNDDHIELLKERDFICSVTTVARLNGPDANPFRLGRICVGPELSGDLKHFALKTAGAIPALRRVR